MRASIAATVALAVSSRKRILMVAAIDAASEDGVGAAIAACPDTGEGADSSIESDFSAGITVATAADASPDAEAGSSMRA